MIRCFLIEPTGDVTVQVMASWPGCEKNSHGNHHHARSVVYQGPESAAPTQSLLRYPFAAQCEYCGESAKAISDAYGSQHVYRRTDTGERRSRINEFPEGAMWFATWYRREDGRYGHDWDNQFEPPLIVKTPGGDWNVDSRASNCTMKEDRLHRCWIRQGTPPEITVGKVGGLTCGAGAGSIQCGNYHGFLRNGYLTTA